MKFIDYAKAARSTAIYRISEAITYPTLGLVNEIGELTDKIYGKVDHYHVSEEIGDILWYIFNLALDCEIDTSMLMENCESFSDIKSTDQYCAGFLYGELFSNAGKICGIVKKIFRDRNGDISLKQRDGICSLLNTMLIQLASLATIRGWSIDKIAQENIQKLSSRQERGMLKGEGDNR